MIYTTNMQILDLLYKYDINPNNSKPLLLLYFGGGYNLLPDMLSEIHFSELKSVTNYRRLVLLCKQLISVGLVKPTYVDRLLDKYNGKWLQNFSRKKAGFPSLRLENEKTVNICSTLQPFNLSTSKNTWSPSTRRCA